jgi:hypothetical protein
VNDVPLLTIITGISIAALLLIYRFLSPKASIWCCALVGLGSAALAIMAYRKSSATQHRKYRPWSKSWSSLMFSSFSSVSL